MKKTKIPEKYKSTKTQVLTLPVDFGHGGGEKQNRAEGLKLAALFHAHVY